MRWLACRSLTVGGDVRVHLFGCIRPTLNAASGRVQPKFEYGERSRRELWAAVPYAAWRLPTTETVLVVAGTTSAASRCDSWTRVASRSASTRCPPSTRAGADLCTGG